MPDPEPDNERKEQGSTRNTGPKGGSTDNRKEPPGNPKGNQRPNK